MFGSLGMPELVIIAVVCLVIFGPRQIPKLGRALGETIREGRNIRKQMAEIHDDATETVKSVERELR